MCPGAAVVRVDLAVTTEGLAPRNTGRTSKKRGGALFLCSSFLLLGRWGGRFPTAQMSAVESGSHRRDLERGEADRSEEGGRLRVPSTVPIGAFPKTPDTLLPSLVLNLVKIVNVLCGFLRVVSDFRAAMYISEVMGSLPPGMGCTP